MNEDLKFYQACYTRLDGNTNASGWKTCNLSPDMRAEMQSFFESSEKVNEIIAAPICLMKIFGNGTYTGISHIQYGTKDNFGRPKFFSHGFVFEDSYEFLKDPNRILTVAPDNFRFTLEETANIPTSLMRTAAWTDESAIRRCGMTKNSYIQYMECVYAALFARTKMTIYVKTDGTDEMMKALLYLTYSALPYSLRPRISASDSEKNAKNMMLVFTSEIPAGYKYVDPKTGANNIVDRAHERRLQENEFALCYVENFPMLPENRTKYYATIEEYLRHMGDIRQSEMGALRLAFNMMTRTKNRSNEAIIGLLYDWLNLNVPTNDCIIQNYCEVLHMISERCKNVLNKEDYFAIPSEIEETLKDRLHQIASPLLEKAYLDYVLSLFTEYQRDDNESFLVLDKQKEDEVLFTKVCAKMYENAAFKDLLRRYYYKQTNELNATEYEQISKFYAEARYRDDRMQRDLLTKCEEIALGEIKKSMKFNQVKASYIRTAESIGISCSIKNLCDTFHQMFMQSFDPKRMAEYREFYKDYPGYTQALQILKAIDIYRERENLKNQNPSEAEEHREFNDYLEANKQTLTTAQISVIIKYLVHKKAPQLCHSVYLWFSLAKALGKNIFAFAVDNEVALFTDADVMKSSMMTNTVWKEKIFKTLLESFDAYERICKGKLSPGMKKVKVMLRDEYDRQKQAIEAEKKRRQQEEEAEKKRLEKERVELAKQQARLKAEEEAKAKAEAKELAKLAKKQGNQKNVGYDVLSMDETSSQMHSPVQPTVVPPTGHITTQGYPNTYSAPYTQQNGYSHPYGQQANQVQQTSYYGQSMNSAMEQTYSMTDYQTPSMDKKAAKQAAKEEAKRQKEEAKRQKDAEKAAKKADKDAKKYKDCPECNPNYVMGNFSAQARQQEKSKNRQNFSTDYADSLNIPQESANEVKSYTKNEEMNDVFGVNPSSGKNKKWGR